MPEKPKSQWNEDDHFVHEMLAKLDPKQIDKVGYCLGMTNLALPWKDRADRYASTDDEYAGMLDEIRPLQDWVRKAAAGKMAMGYNRKDMEEYVKWVVENGTSRR